MGEYLKAFYVYQDFLFWEKDVDDKNKRIDMWLKSDKCKEFGMVAFTHKESENNS